MGLEHPPLSAVRNGIPTPPSSPTSDTADPSLEAKPTEHDISVQDGSNNHFDLPPTPSSSSHSSRDAGASTRSPAPKIQGGHRFYSERNPVPKVDHFPWESIYRGPVGIYRSPLALRQQRRTGNIPVIESSTDNRTERREVDKNGSGPGNAPSGSQGLVPNETGGGSRPPERSRKGMKNDIVTDPITRKEVSVVDAKDLPPPSIPLSIPTLSPPSSWTLYSSELRYLTLKYIVIILLSFLVLSGLFGLHMSFPLFVSLGVIVAWYRQVDGLWLDVVHHDPILYHRKGLNRSSTSTPPTSSPSAPRTSAGPESVIWLNNTIGKLWPQINGDLFKPVTDMLEDVMQASIPSVIQQIRVRDIGQGMEPIKILSMQWLDHDDVEIEDDKSYSPQNSEEDLAGTGGEGQESKGQWASMEIKFSFRGIGRGLSGSNKGSNPFLMINMSLGLQGVLGAPELPLWVELRGLSGTCRLKVQFIPDPPFVRLVTFSFMGTPEVEIAVVPLNQRFLNVMSLPVISDFVYSSIKTLAREFCAPKSFTMDLSQMLVGDDIKRELGAIGVLVVHIDRAEGVRAADTLTGKSDCYVTLSYAKFAKKLWSSRIIFCELNPIWDETAILLVNMDEIKAAERLKVEIWDSDRFTVDDLLGRVEVDVEGLVRKKGGMRARKSTLMGYTSDQRMPGTLTWSVGFYGMAELDGNSNMVRTGLDSGSHLTKEVEGGASSHDTPLVPPMPATPSPSTLATRVPPSESFPSGILSVQVHNITNLSATPPSGTRASKQRIGVTTNMEEEEEGESHPSAYCSIMLDYQRIYKTRIKPMTSKPFFNAGTERFVRDWRHSSVIVVVRDSRMREEDPILGIVELRLKDVFRKESVVSRYYPIQGGIGYGKIRISLLFRSIDKLPKMLLGADIGSLEIVNQRIDGSHITDEEVKKAGCIIFDTPLTKERAIRETSTDVGWSCVSGVMMGVRDRHSSACILYFKRHQGNLKFRKEKVIAAAKFWLKDIPDSKIVSLTLDVFKPEDMDRFMQNASDDGTYLGPKVGYIELKVRFHRGLDDNRGITAGSDRDLTEVIMAVRATKIASYEEEHSRNRPGIDSESDINDHEKEKMSTGAGSTRELLAQPGSSSHGVHTMPASTSDTLPIVGSGVDKDEVVYSDGHSSSSHNESEIELEDVINHSAKAKHVRTNSVPNRSVYRPPQIMTKQEIRREMNRRERGVMQWKGARTLAWVGRGVKDASRGVTERLARRAGERGKNVGPGTEV